MFLPSTVRLTNQGLLSSGAMRTDDSGLCPFPQLQAVYKGCFSLCLTPSTTFHVSRHAGDFSFRNFPQEIWNRAERLVNVAVGSFSGLMDKCDAVCAVVLEAREVVAIAPIAMPIVLASST